MSKALCLGLCAALLAAGCGGGAMRRPLSVAELRGLNTELQSHQFSCGAACLATLMSAVGEETSELEVLTEVFGNELRARATSSGEIEIDTLSVYELLEVARAHGLAGVALEAPGGAAGRDLLDALKPVMARVKLYGTVEHFVVVRDICNGWVQISDPGYGSYRVPLSQFDEAWQAGGGVVAAVGREPFVVWHDAESDLVYLRREPVAGSESAAVRGSDLQFPLCLWRNARGSLTLTSAVYQP